MPTPGGKALKKRNKNGKKLVTDLAKQEIRQFERQTPFYKKGIEKEASQSKPGSEEHTLSQMQLSDLQIDTAKKLGSGSYGNVYKALYKPMDKQVAVKKLLKAHFTKSKMAKALENEI